MAGTLTVKPGETVTVVGIPAEAPLPPYIPGPVDPGYSPPWAQVRPPVDPGYSPPWAQVPPGGQGGGPVDPGYSPPWAQVRPPVDPGYSPPWAQVPEPGGPRPSHPSAMPGDPWWGQDLRPTHPIVIPPTEPPPTQPPPSDSGNWVWAWSPQAGRWVWVKVPGEGEAGPKVA